MSTFRGAVRAEGTVWVRPFLNDQVGSRPKMQHERQVPGM